MAQNNNNFWKALGSLSTALGTGLSVGGAMTQGREADVMSQYQQLAYNREAERVMKSATEEARQTRQAGKRLTSTQKAEIAASGTRLSQTNLKILIQSAMEVEKDVSGIFGNARYEAGKLRTQGALARRQGKQAKRGSRIRAMSELFGAGGKLAAIYRQPDVTIPELRPTDPSKTKISQWKQSGRYLTVRP